MNVLHMPHLAPSTLPYPSTRGQTDVTRETTLQVKHVLLHNNNN